MITFVLKFKPFNKMAYTFQLVYHPFLKTTCSDFSVNPNTGLVQYSNGVVFEGLVNKVMLQVPDLKSDIPTTL